MEAIAAYQAGRPDQAEKLFRKVARRQPNDVDAQRMIGFLCSQTDRHTEAVDRFDADREVAFSTFAVPTILGELKRHFRDTAWAVHMPRSLSEGALRVEKTERGLANETGHRPSVAEIADAMGEDLEWVVNVLDASRAHDALSLDATVDTPDGDGETLAATLGGEDERFDYVEERDAVACSLGQLTARERRVLELRFGAEMTQSEIAEQIGVSQMQVSRILRRTLDRLRTLTEASPV